MIEATAEKVERLSGRLALALDLVAQACMDLVVVPAGMDEVRDKVLARRMDAVLQLFEYDFHKARAAAALFKEVYNRTQGP
jgi:hypothetical protein